EREVRGRAAHVRPGGPDAGQQGAAGGHLAQSRSELRQTFAVQYQTAAGGLEHVWNTSWGVSTRMIGGLVMTHSDDNGLVCPPKLAPVQVAIVPIWKSDEERSQVLAVGDKVKAEL